MSKKRLYSNSSNNNSNNNSNNLNVNVTKRIRVSTFEGTIKSFLEKIIFLINNNNILKENYELNTNIVEHKADYGYIYVTISIVDILKNTTISFVQVKYIQAKYDKDKGICLDIKSQGMRMGTFLFHLVLLLTYYLGIQDFTLDNYTDDQLRAALGIYKLLDVNKRGEDPLLFTNASFEEQIAEAHGKMRLLLSSNTIEGIIIEIKNIGNKIKTMPLNNSDSPWNPNIDKGITKFIREIKEQGFYANGGKKTRKSKKTKKSKKTRKSKKNKKLNIF